MRPRLVFREGFWWCHFAGLCVRGPTVTQAWSEVALAIDRLRLRLDQVEGELRDAHTLLCLQRRQRDLRY